MIEEKFRNKYRISSSRKPWYNYNIGCYFVTICTKDMEYYFGNIENNTMILSDIGRFTNDLIAAIPQNYQGTEVLSYVVMPNHLHMIICIHAEVGTTDDSIDTSCNDAVESKHEFMQEISTNMGKLSKVVNHLKGAITKYARANAMPFAWQSRFYDEIIRDEEAFINIKRYIETNIYRWDK